MIDFDYTTNKAHLESFASKSGYGSPSWLSTYYDFPVTTYCMGDTRVEPNLSINKNLIVSITYGDGLLKILLNSTITGNTVLNLYNVNGARIGSIQKNIVTENEHQIEFNKNQLSKEIFFVTCISNRMIEPRKVIIF